jgi:2-haloacid dehalogenase
LKYNTIFFDADGTLFDFDASERESLLSALQSVSDHGFGDAEVETYRRINTSFWQKLERGEIDSVALHSRRFEQYVREINLDIRPELLGDAYLKNLELIVFMASGAIELLERLWKRIPMALITNGFSRVQRSKIEITGISKYFDTIVISEEAGSTKPETAIFELAAKEIGGVRKSDTLMVGDSVTSDIQGGLNFGIDTCLIDSGTSAHMPELTPAPTYRINHLAQLDSIIGLPKD